MWKTEMEMSFGGLMNAKQMINAVELIQYSIGRSRWKHFHCCHRKRHQKEEICPWLPSQLRALRSTLVLVEWKCFCNVYWILASLIKNIANRGRLQHCPSWRRRGVWRKIISPCRQKISAVRHQETWSKHLMVEWCWNKAVLTDESQRRMCSYRDCFVQSLINEFFF